MHVMHAKISKFELFVIRIVGLLRRLCGVAGGGGDRLEAAGLHHLPHEALEAALSQPGRATTCTLLHQIRRRPLAWQAFVRQFQVALNWNLLEQLCSVVRTTLITFFKPEIWLKRNVNSGYYLLLFLQQNFISNNLFLMFWVLFFCVFLNLKCWRKQVMYCSGIIFRSGEPKPSESLF